MFYRIAYWLFWPLFKLFYRIKFVGRENMPLEGPVVLVSNHASYLDPICLGLASRRPIIFMAKEELFSYPVLKHALLGLDTLSIRRGQSDRAAIRSALEVLRQNRVIGMFPQGTRVKSYDHSIGQKGAALLALKSGAMLLPVALLGTERIMPPGRRLPRFPKIKVVFGRPFKIEAEPGKSNRLVITEATERMMSAIAGLMEL